MEQHAILQADYLDILFDKRNKKYGGYELRRHYGNRALKALISVITIAGALCLFLLPSEQTVEIVARTLQPTVLTQISNVLPPLPTPKTITAPANASTADFSTPVIVENDRIKETELAAVDDLTKSPPGKETADGEETTANSGPGTVSTGESPNDGTELSTISSEPIRYAAEMPSFEGDLKKYLNSNIRYPSLARENGIQGKVTVEFIVNEDGSISNVKTLRGIGGGCDEEAMRVVKNMPKWKPGKQNERKIKVYLVLPISFKLE